MCTAVLVHKVFTYVPFRCRTHITYVYNSTCKSDQESMKVLALTNHAGTSCNDAANNSTARFARGVVPVRGVIFEMKSRQPASAWRDLDYEKVSLTESNRYAAELSLTRRGVVLTRDRIWTIWIWFPTGRT